MIDLFLINRKKVQNDPHGPLALKANENTAVIAAAKRAKKTIAKISIIRVFGFFY
jgi:hypothetical protein